MNDTPAPQTHPLTVVVCSVDPTVVQFVNAAMLRSTEMCDVFPLETEEGTIAMVSKLGQVDIAIVYCDGTGASVALMERLRRLSPQTVRIALSEPANEAVMPRLAASAHQILPMPLDIEVLGDLVGRVRHSSETELSEPVRSMVGQADRLPSPPKMFQRLNELLARDDWRVEDLAAEIETDVALTSELLKLVNSSFYGAGSRVRSVSRAISLIGTKLTRFIVLGNQLFVSSGGFDTWIDLERLAGRSNAVARGARALAQREHENDDVAASAYLAGLVSEIGLLVMARLPDIDPTIAAPVNSSVFLGAERVLFGGDRFQVGTHLLTLWGFDHEVIEAVEKLSTEKSSAPRELGWYLASTRELVIKHGMDPDELSRPQGWDSDLDELVAACHARAVDAAVPVAV